MDVQRLRAGWPGSLLLPPLEDDAGEVAALDGPPTVTAAHVNGRTTIEVGPATATTDGGWAVAAPAAMTADLSAWIISWAGTIAGATLTVTRMAEVVGGFAFTVRECRGHDETLADEAKYPTPAIIEARTFAEQRFENAAEVAYVPRYARVTATRPTITPAGPSLPSLYWGPTSWLLVPDVEIRRLLTVDGAAPTDTQTLDRTGRLSGVNPGQVVEYEHGRDGYPAEVKRATLMLAADYLIKSALPSRATSVSTDEGYLRISVAGRDGLTGIPEVDAAIEQYGRRRPAAG